MKVLVLVFALLSTACSGPVVLSLSSELAPDYREPVRDALERSVLAFRHEGVDVVLADEDDVLGSFVVDVRPDVAFLDGAIGVTHRGITGGAQWIHMDPRVFEPTQANTWGHDAGRDLDDAGAWLMRCAVRHEVGHAIGLEHVSGETSLMYPQVGLKAGADACLWSYEDRNELEREVGP